MPTILLVEDELTLAETLRYNLEREGYSVLTAADGVHGLELARREQPDLLILDIMLPRLDGFSVCRILRQESDVPILMLTARQDEVEDLERVGPLLLGLYHLLPSRNKLKQPDIDWVVIEEPEMGLHPQAISVFMLLVLDLLWRGYRVVLSTHSPLVLTVVWMLKRLRAAHAPWQLVSDAFGVAPGDRSALKKVAEAALEKKVRTYLLAFGDDHLVRSKDISSLDPGDEDDDISEWGGLTGFNARFGEAVRQAVNTGANR